MFARLIATPSFCMGALLAIAANTATGQQRATVHPDFQGNWVNRFATPLERPKELDNRPLLTDQEVAELNKQAKRSFNGIYAYYQIVQTQDYLMFFMEAVHEARIIPLDGRPHLPSSMRTWDGDSRGH